MAQGDLEQGVGGKEGCLPKGPNRVGPLLIKKKKKKKF